MPRQNGKPVWEQRRWVAFAILALLVLVSTAASAQTTTMKSNETHDWSETVDNPCNTDMVTINGKHHIVMTQQEQKNGRVHLQMTEDRHGQGVGVPSGKKYSYGNKLKTNVFLPAPPEGEPVGITRSRVKIVSEGSSPDGDNFFATFMTRVHRNGTTTRHAEFDCRGQGKGF